MKLAVVALEHIGGGDHLDLFSGVDPTYQWTVRGDVDEKFGSGFKSRLKMILLDLEDPELLAAFPRRSFVPASNDDYLPILDVARSVGLID